ncbi:MAG: class I tRNA ligase family protein, partial [Terracidiphilus sp.]
VKVTPAHDPNDFALGERHHLPSINVMDDRAHINENGGTYQGLDRYVARKKIVADLEEQGLLAGIKDHINNVGHCDRCKTVVEPRLSTQWFIAVNKEPNSGGESMAQKAIAAVQPGSGGTKAIRFTPENYEKVYLEWMNNIHDWCISRQLWWGHRIPAWHCAACHKITVPEPNSTADPAACAHCGSGQIMQETDVLDTWFSSGLLPVSVFGWPNLTKENRADFDAFYPTSLLVTGFDILFFWVARMIMLGCWFAGDIPMPDGSPRPLAESVPFKEVYIHALVRDANREKMSKTKGNVIDPIEIVKQYGTDAVRFTLASMASPGTDIAFNVARTEGYRAFANKIWNAARFIFMNIDRAAEIGITVDPRQLPLLPMAGADAPLEDRWIIAEFHSTASKVDRSLKDYRYDDAANSIYQFFWGSFCDWYLEIVKLRLEFSATDDKETRAALTALLSVFEASLRLLSPFMPFITEQLWHALYEEQPPKKSIALMSYPPPQQIHTNAQIEMEALQSLIGDIRELRKAAGVGERQLVQVKVHSYGFINEHRKNVFVNNRGIIQRLAKVSEIEFSETPLTGIDTRSSLGVDVRLLFEAQEKQVDTPAERDRLIKDIARYEKGLAAAEKQLGNEAFRKKAPLQVVEGLKKQETETRLLLEKARAALATLPGD